MRWVIFLMFMGSSILMLSLLGLASFALGAGDLLDNTASWALAHGW